MHEERGTPTMKTLPNTRISKQMTIYLQLIISVLPKSVIFHV